MALVSSYDLMVFEPELAPKDYEEFLAWFAEEMKCDEGHTYTDSRVTTERLRGWYRDTLLEFPSGADGFEENGPEEHDEDSYSGYCIGMEMIYVIFVPVHAELARRTAFELATKHGLGVFEASSASAELWWPQAGKLELLHQQEVQVQEPGFWERLTGRSKGMQLPRPRLPDWM